MRKKVYVFIMGFLATIAFAFNLNESGSFVNSINTYNVYIYLFVFLGICLVISKNYKKAKNKKTIFLISSLISISNLLALIYTKYNGLHILFSNFFMAFKSIIIFIGFFILFYYIVSAIWNMLTSKNHTYKNKILNFFFEEHPLIFTIIALAVIYIPLLFVIYPGDVCYDAFDQLKQYYGLPTASVRYINLLNPEVYINGHHSVLHTYVIGLINDFGIMLGNSNIGLFLNVLLQVALVVGCLSYCVLILKKFKIPLLVRLGIMMFYLLTGYLTIFSTAIYKDLPYCIFMLLYTITLMELVLDENISLKDILKVIIISSILVLLNKKAIYSVLIVLLVSSILYLFKKIKSRKIFLTIITVIFYIVVSDIIYPALYFTPGSVREPLAIPIQQISRLIITHENDLSSEELNAIEGILDYKNIKKYYVPNNVDYVKANLFNKEYTSEEMKEFILVYIKLFFKFPSTYISAFVNSTYEYFGGFNIKSPLPAASDSWNYIDKRITYSRVEWRENARKKLFNIYQLAMKLPLVGLLYTIPTYTWLLIIICAIILLKKETKYIIPAIPSFTALLLLLLSPVNGVMRYAFPIIFSMPMLIGYVLILKDKKRQFNFKLR